MCQKEYFLTKHNIILLSKYYAKYLKINGIRVNCIRPGVIETNMSGPIMNRIKDQIKEITSLGRFGQTKEISKMTTFLASDVTSSYITGECITIDGGII